MGFLLQLDRHLIQNGCNKSFEDFF
jgi:hypothetical protein